MRRTITIIGVAGLATGCATISGAASAIGDWWSANVDVMSIDAVVTAYRGLVDAHGQPGSDHEFMELLQKAAGLIFERREALREFTLDAANWLLGAGSLLGFQGLAFGRGRSLVVSLLSGLVRRDGKQVVSSAAGLLGAHSGKALGQEPPAPPPPEGA